MGRKGKTQKHTAKEINSKHKAAKAAAGGAGHGGAGLKARQEAAAKIQVKCSICLAIQPHLAGMRNHYEGKHSQAVWSDSLYQDQFLNAKIHGREKDPLREAVGKHK